MQGDRKRRGEGTTLSRRSLRSGAERGQQRGVIRPPSRPFSRQPQIELARERITDLLDRLGYSRASMCLSRHCVVGDGDYGSAASSCAKGTSRKEKIEAQIGLGAVDDKRIR